MHDETQDFHPATDEPTASSFDVGMTRTYQPTSAGPTSPTEDQSAAPLSFASPPGFALHDEIGRGGMGVVFRARDLALERDVAVKILLDRFAADDAAVRRFMQEAQITGQLQHPGIPAVYQVGALPDGRPFLAMKLIQGRTLGQLLKEPRGAAERGRFLAAFEQIGQAVAFAHARRVVHRDLKPHNVMVGAFGEVQVMDWGLAKVLPNQARANDSVDPPSTISSSELRSPHDRDTETMAGSILGTPAFMPPEQAAGALDQVDERADVFSLGAVLCVLLTGEPLYLGKSLAAVHAQAVRGELAGAFSRLDRCGAEPELVALAKRCLAVERAERPRDAGAVAGELAVFRAAAEERARVAELNRVRAEGDRRTAELKVAEERKRRRVLLALAACLLTLVAGAGIAAWVFQAQRTEQEQLQAERLRQEADTERERAEQQNRTRRVVQAALARLPALYEKGLWNQANGTLDEATHLVDQEHAEPTLRAQVETARRDTDCIAKLDRLRLGNALGMGNPIPPNRSFDEFATVFRENGFEVLDGDPADLASRLKTSTVRDYLLAALDYWALHDCERHGKRLFALTAAMTDQPWRARILDVLLDGPQLASLYDQIPPDQRTSPVIFWVCVHLSRGLHFDKGERLEAALLRYPSDLHLHLEAARLYLDVPDRAIAEYKAALALRPGDWVLLISLGKQLVAMQRPLEAEVAFREAASSEPECWEPYGCLGGVLKPRDPDGASVAYRAALRLATREPPLQISYLEGELGQCLVLKGSPDEAVPVLLEALRHNPKHVSAQITLAEVLAQKGDRDAALRHAQHALGVSPNPRVYLTLGRVHEAAGRLQSAADAFRQANEKALSNPTYKQERQRLDQRLKVLSEQLAAVKAGKPKPGSAEESAVLAALAGDPARREYALTLQLYTAAFAANPKLLPEYRAEAALAAFRLADGDDLSAPPTEDRCAELYRQALAWLTADLADRRQLAASHQPYDLDRVNATLARWLGPDLGFFRVEKERRCLTADERKAWQLFWEEVRKLSEETGQKQ